jgi:hypothetical protein
MGDLGGDVGRSQLPKQVLSADVSNADMNQSIASRNTERSILTRTASEKFNCVSKSRSICTFPLRESQQKLKPYQFIVFRRNGGSGKMGGAKIQNAWTGLA